MPEDSRSTSSAPAAPAPAPATITSKPAREGRVPWWRNPSVLIAALAFCLSLITSLFAGVTAYRKDIHDRQAELSGDIGKILDLQADQANLYATEGPANAARLQPVFSEHYRVLTFRAYSLARHLGLNAPAPDLMQVANMLRTFENFSAAKEMYRQATLVADNFSDDVSALRAYGLIMISFGSDAHERAEGERAFEKAVDIGARYPDVAHNLAEISYTNALTQVAWTDAWSGIDCRKAEVHLHAVDGLIVKALADPRGIQLRSMAEAWHASLRHCDANNRLPFQWRPGMPGTWGAVVPPLGGSNARPPAQGGP